MISHEMRTLSFTLPLKIRGIQGVMKVSQSFHNSPACQALACLRQSFSEGKRAGLTPLTLRGENLNIEILSLPPLILRGEFWEAGINPATTFICRVGACPRPLCFCYQPAWLIFELVSFVFSLL